MCECPWCTYRGSGTCVPLPVLLTITLGERTFRAWAWLLDTAEKRVWLGTWLNTESVLQYRQLSGDRRVARAVLKEYGVHPGTTVPLVQWTVCTHGTPTPLSAAVTGSVSFVHAAVEHCACTLPTLALFAPPSKKRKEATVTSDDGGYDPALLGGDANEVGELLTKRNAWDQEMVDELLRVGARPPLEVHRIHNNGRYRAAQCTVRQPCGQKVEGVWLPMSVLRRKYAEEVAHLC